MHVRTLATVSADGNTDVELRLPTNYDRVNTLVQITVTGTITIQLLGSLDGAAYSEILAAAGTSRVASVLVTPFMRITSSSTSGGSAVLKVLEGGPRPLAS